MARARSGQVDETLDSQRARSERSSAARAAPARLTVVHPPELRGELDLGAERLVLGRAPDEPGSPPLHDPTVSRAHFAVEWDAGAGVYLGRDLGSRNGSWLDGRRVDEDWVPLSPGGVLRVGDVLLVLEPGRTLDEADAPEVSRQAIPGRSLAARALRAALSRAAADLSPVLILGQTGTGKERIAQEVHARSGRKGPLLAVNCATLGEQLIESQLFGHVKGAFTGAAADHAGLFRAADGGSLFLDEIGELGRDLQAKLLRAIQEREVLAVGATRPVKVDVRIIAATHRDLVARVEAGEFRQDLYARLALWPLAVAPLVERKADLFLWFERLFERWAEERGQEGRRAPDFEADAAELLLLAQWPENLRGLDRFVHELAARRVVGRPVGPADLPSWLLAPAREGSRAR